ncbi:MAG: MYXO-CTERM domain-containing protein [Phycisphaerales bacterium]|jgi:MYXO-CTERM domain-containing protein
MSITKNALCLTSMALACAITVAPANAAIVINLNEVGGNIEMDFSGTMDLDALHGMFGTFAAYNGLISNLGVLATSGSVDAYNIDPSYSQWTAYGTDGSFFSWSSTTGDAFALYSNPALGLYAGYQSGDYTSGTATLLGQSLASAGMITGTYVTSLTGVSGATDSVIVNVGTVPAPGALALLGLAGLATRRRRS